MQGLTERQQQILNAVIGYINEKGYPPTIRELADIVGVKSSSTLHGHLQRLEKKGYITKEKRKPRTIVPTVM
ncbi:transcriptional repressor, LexA family [Caldicellulosiruptor acetigenus I77R1B]|uniref:Transcriptional repressor, LexA family n=1 Tax=Caldicellulosiruptor acetigenus (strain ATCC 700853 / DSM 12137 / I77R1B) TaxID=632335 RepID=E4S5C4_CALA7|nr:MarR family transcriptional regulator [Caldicellulosiruptor acetigenus]ADQ41558.1 transcriptional repressor, LexA family [Caldicellulosiruptor acetigenus I77R1B]